MKGCLVTTAVRAYLFGGEERGVRSEKERRPSGVHLKDELDALSAECGITYAQICELYKGFARLEANESGEVELKTIRDMLVTMSITPIDDEALEAWMAEADSDGSSSLSFFQHPVPMLSTSPC